MGGGSRESTPERLAAELRRRILSGEIAPGLRLPPERTLAEEWDANRHTVREALRLLEAQGLLETRQGSGATVLDFRAKGRLELAPFYFEAIGLVPTLASEIDAFLRIRRAVMVEAAFVAAREGGEELRSRVTKVAEELLAARGDTRRVVELDFALYRTLMDATGRLLFRWVSNSFADRVQPIIENFAFVWPRPDNYFDSLWRMASLVARGIPEEAREATRRHLEETDRQVMDAIHMFLGAGQRAREGGPREGGPREG